MLRDPVAARLARTAGWPSPRVTLLMAAGLAFGMAGLMLAASGPALTQQPSFAGTLRPALTLLAAASFLFAFASPALSAALAARLTFQERRSGALELLRLTSLPRRAIVLGYVRGAAWRLRLLLAVAAGLLPAQMLGALLTILWFLQRSPAYYLRQQGWPVLAAMIPQQAPGTALAWLAIPVGLWLCHITAVGVGVSAALVARREGPALWGAALIMLAVMAGLHLAILRPDPFVPVAGFIAASAANPANYLIGLGRWTIWGGGGWPVVMLLAGLLAAPPLVAAGSVRLAERAL